MASRENSTKFEELVGQAVALFGANIGYGNQPYALAVLGKALNFYYLCLWQNRNKEVNRYRRFV